MSTYLTIRNLLPTVLTLQFLILMDCQPVQDNQRAELNFKSATKQEKDTTEFPLFLKKLQTAYPDFIVNITSNALIWSDGTEMTYDDGFEKDFIQMLNQADVEDQFYFTYPPNHAFDQPKYLNDPGRIRHTDFFKKIYGQTQKEVESNLVDVQWLPSHTQITLKFNQQNGASEALQKVSNEFDQKPHLIKYLNNPAGTFNWRKISGSDRYSLHSFGIAIDINVAFSNYWKWSHPNASETDSLKYENKIPSEIVQVFEKYGFIWGGKWYHYDTMHFEYRPEFF